MAGSNVKRSFGPGWCGWVRVELRETTQAKPGGPFQQRTISIHLRGEDRKELIRYLGGKA